MSAFSVENVQMLNEESAVSLHVSLKVFRQVLARVRSNSGRYSGRTVGERLERASCLLQKVMIKLVELGIISKFL